MDYLNTGNQATLQMLQPQSTTRVVLLLDGSILQMTQAIIGMCQTFTTLPQPIPNRLQSLIYLLIPQLYGEMRLSL